MYDPEDDDDYDPDNPWEDDDSDDYLDDSDL